MEFSIQFTESRIDLSASFVHVCQRRKGAFSSLCVLPKAPLLVAVGFSLSYSLVACRESLLPPSSFEEEEGIQRTAEHVLVSLGLRRSCSSSHRAQSNSIKNISSEKVAFSVKIVERFLVFPKGPQRPFFGRKRDKMLMHKEYWIYILCLIKSLTLFGTKGLWQQTGLLFSNWEGLALFLDENDGITEMKVTFGVAELWRRGYNPFIRISPVVTLVRKVEI